MIRILVAHDMRMIRSALIALLEREPDFKVVAEAGSGDRVLPLALEHTPDVAIIDLGLPCAGGVAVGTCLRERIPECAVLVTIGPLDPVVLRQALDARFDGYLPKSASPSQLAEAVRKVAAGQRAVDPQVALAAWDGLGSPLTERELEVLQRAAEGAGVPEIAETLHLSRGTVRNYLTTVVSKLKARNRLDAVRIAASAGWLRADGWRRDPARRHDSPV